MFMKKTLPFLLLAAVIIFVATHYFKPDKKQPLKIGISSCPGTAHVFIAQQKGFFEKNGVEVELVLKQNVTESSRMYRYGQVDGVFTLVPEVVVFNSEGIGTKIVYVICSTNTIDAIVGRPEFDSLADLKGKKVGFEGVNTSSHVFVLKALEQAGVNESDIYFESVYVSDVLPALEQGRISAGHIWGVSISQALKSGYKVLCTAAEVPGVTTHVLVFESKTVEKRPQDIKAIIKSISEAQDYMHTNTEEAIEIVSKALNLDSEELLEGIENVAHLGLEDNLETMKKSGQMTSIYRDGEIVADFFWQKGQISRVPDFDGIVEPKFVKALAASARDRMK
jgi:NitT/TauT family transport system substrate-binding protein